MFQIWDSENHPWFYRDVQEWGIPCLYNRAT